MLCGPGWGVAVLAAARQSGRRGHGLATLEKIVTALLEDANGGATSGPTWAVLIAASGRGERTVARWVRWLRAKGLLVTVENGSTEQFRPQDMPLEGNRCAVYLLTEPLSDLAAPLAPSAAAGSPAAGPHLVRVPRVGRLPASLLVRAESVSPQSPPTSRRTQRSTHARTSACARPPGPLEAPGRTKSGRGGSEKQVSEWPAGLLGPRARRRCEQLAVAAALRERALDLRGISAAAVASVVRPFLAAGWGVEDLIHAIDHAPDGTRRYFAAGAVPQPWAGIDVDRPEPALRSRTERQSAPVASPGAWLAWRLRPWAGHQPPAAARRAAGIAARAAAAAAAVVRRAQNAATAAAAVPAPPSITAARKALRESAAGRPRAVRRPWTPT